MLWTTGLVKAAYDFNLTLTAASGEAESGGASGSNGAAAAPEEDGGGSLVDDEWRPIPGGPFTGEPAAPRILTTHSVIDMPSRTASPHIVAFTHTLAAKLMSKSRQPVSTATYRNYGVAVPFNPIDGPLSPGGQIKFPIVPGAPAEGIVVQLPSSWDAHTHVLIFKLKLSKAGATEPTVTIASALYRDPRVETDEDEEAYAKEGADGDIASTVPATPVHDMMANEPPLHPSPLIPAAGATQEHGEEEDAIENGASSDEGEELPQWVLDQTGGGASDRPQPLHLSPHAALPPNADEAGAEAEDAVELAGEEDATEEEAGPAVVLTDEEIAERLKELHCAWHDDEELQLDGTDQTEVEGVITLLKEVHAEACVLVVPGFTYTIQRSAYGARSLVATSEVNELEANVEMDGGGGGDLAPPPPPLPPPLPPPPLFVPPRSSARHSKRKERFGDNGELDGAASSFRSMPPPRKASVDPSVEMGVPAYALPGEQVWAMGLRAGVRMRFKAEVTKLRKQFPRIVVKYIATEQDETSRHVLPDVVSAYLHMGDVEARDW